ncbi:hypothetical protein Pve01_14440 [Planomonospora venezuelensis]|nr:hypothetical protein Pve01_14440 [Planomonospora venezuelensis]
MGRSRSPTLPAGHRPPDAAVESAGNPRGIRRRTAARPFTERIGPSGAQPYQMRWNNAFYISMVSESQHFLRDDY